MRPHVICHMCTTIDGKILVGRWDARLAQTTDGRSLFETTAASFGIKAWIVGTHTMKEFSAKRRGQLARAAEAIPAGDFIAVEKASRLAIGTDTHGVLRFDKNEVEGDHIVVLLTRKVSKDYLAHLRSKQVSYLFCGSSTLNLKVALAKIRRRLGVRQLMLEGGGRFNGAMLKAGLVDEISQVIVPALDGGVGVTSFVEIDGARRATRLRLIKHRTLPGGVNWLRYQVR